MKIFACYILLDDGTCLFSSAYFKMPESALITAMISAMQAFIREVSGSRAKKLSTEGFVFHIDIIGRFSVVLATDSDVRPAKELQSIRTRFISKYGAKIDGFQGVVDQFAPFANDLLEILDLEEQNRRIEPRTPLNSFALLKIPKELQNVAREVIMAKETTSIKIAEKLEEPNIQIQIKLDDLFTQGYLGRYHDGAHLIYFV